MARSVGLEAAAMTDSALFDRLLKEPQAYDFFQAVHLLERLLPDRAPIGEFADPDDEVVRFKTPTAVGFPASEIQDLEPGIGRAPATMTVNFMGLTGPQGTLPLAYSLYAGQRARVGDDVMKEFLGLFEHRILSLFYRAWAKSRATIGFDDHSLPRTDDTPRQNRDWLTRHLLSLLGLGTPGLANRMPVPDESMLYFAGLLALPSRPAAALEQLVADAFGVPVEVEQFVGAWYPLGQTAQTALSDDGFGSAPLGGGAVAGDEVWDEGGRVRIRIGPLARRAYDDFLPGGASHDALRALTRFFANDQFDFEIQLVLARDETPPLKLDADAVPLPLGWCTWLNTAPLERDPDDALFAL
jgi:type VI secretion system protein ImpH